MVKTNPLTIHLLTKNNLATIKAAFKSIAPLQGSVVVFDIGSTDGTVTACKELGAKVIECPNGDHRGRVRNQIYDLSNHDWQMYIEPWEMVVDGTGEITKILSGGPAAYRSQIIQNDVVTKQVRIWHRDTGIRFDQPIYESLTTKGSKHSRMAIYADPVPDPDKMILVQDWVKNNPANEEAHYYSAFAKLEMADYDGFLKSAANYTFRVTGNQKPVIMIKYYMALVQCAVKKNATEALKNIIPCLIANPVMSEFWCLLGDVHYFLTKRYDKAKAFYENAILAGSRRLKNDEWPMQLSKYADYPQKMAASCGQLVKSAHLLAR